MDSDVLEARSVLSPILPPAKKFQSPATSTWKSFNSLTRVSLLFSSTHIVFFAVTAQISNSKLNIARIKGLRAEWTRRSPEYASRCLTLWIGGDLLRVYTEHAWKAGPAQLCKCTDDDHAQDGHSTVTSSAVRPHVCVRCVCT